MGSLKRGRKKQEAGTKRGDLRNQDQRKNLIKQRRDNQWRGHLKETTRWKPGRKGVNENREEKNQGIKKRPKKGTQNPATDGGYEKKI